MAGSNLPKEAQIYVQQLNKQVCEIYNPDTDGKIYNPARDGASVYRTTRDVEHKNALPLPEQINKYIKLKALQAAIYLVGFLAGFICLGYLGPAVEKRYIYAHILTWWFFIRSVCSTIATVLLYCGNKKEDTKLLKAFLTVGRLSYSWFDYYAGGFKVVRRRILEIMPKHAGNPAIAPPPQFSQTVPPTNSHYTNDVPLIL